MINYLQLNKNKEQKVLTKKVWSELLGCLKDKTPSFKERCREKIDEIGQIYNINIKNTVKEFMNYIIREHIEYVSPKFLTFCETLMHIQETNTNYYKNYFIVQSRDFFLESP